MIRSTNQNNAAHKWFREMAETLNEAGLDVQIVLSHDKLETMWTEELFKEIIVKQFAKAIYGKDKTSELTTKEFSEVMEAISKGFNREFGIYLRFPSKEEE